MMKEIVKCQNCDNEVTFPSVFRAAKGEKKETDAVIQEAAVGCKSDGVVAHAHVVTCPHCHVLLGLVPSGRQYYSY